MVEHKGTQNQCHFPSCSETGHKERWAGRHDIGWWRVKLYSLRRWLLTTGYTSLNEWWHSLNEWWHSLLPYKFGVLNLDLQKLPWRQSSCNWAKRQYVSIEKQWWSWEQVNFHVCLGNLISVDSSIRDEIKRR